VSEVVAYPDCSVIVVVDDGEACAIKIVRNRSDASAFPTGTFPVQYIVRQLGDSGSGIYCQSSDIRDVDWHCSR